MQMHKSQLIKGKDLSNFHALIVVVVVIFFFFSFFYGIDFSIADAFTLVASAYNFEMWFLYI